MANNKQLWGGLNADWRSGVLQENKSWSDTPGFNGVCYICQQDNSNCHEHHISYDSENTRERTIVLCSECHYKVHNEDGFHDDLEPDFLRRRRERREEEEGGSLIKDAAEDEFAEIDGSVHHLVELPSAFLNNNSPELIGTFATEEDAKQKMWKKINALDLHGSDYQVMESGQSITVSVEILGFDREMYLCICESCYQVQLTDYKESTHCTDCAE